VHSWLFDVAEVGDAALPSPSALGAEKEKE